MGAIRPFPATPTDRCPQQPDSYRSINAEIESFWGQVQIELLNRCKWRARLELATALFKYMEIVHNRERPHRRPGHSHTGAI